jgi:hypothetical protein
MKKSLFFSSFNLLIYSYFILGISLVDKTVFKINSLIQLTNKFNLFAKLL